MVTHISEGLRGGYLVWLLREHAGYLHLISECLGFEPWFYGGLQLPCDVSLGRQKVMGQYLDPCHRHGGPGLSFCLPGTWEVNQEVDSLLYLLNKNFLKMIRKRLLKVG